MHDASRKARLVFSLDVDMRARRADATTQHAIELAANALAHLLATHQIAATWALADWTAASTIDQLVSIEPAQELALLGQRNWAECNSSRKQFANELSQRVARARAAGLHVTSLALADCQLADHFDLVFKHGITAVRTPPPTSPRQTTFRQRLLRPANWWRKNRRRAKSDGQPRLLRWGLWEMAPTLAMPRAGTGRVTRALESSISDRRLIHLAIDVAQVAELQRKGMRGVERVVRCAWRYQREGLLQCTTMAQVAAQLLQPRNIAARSILRTAA